MCRDVLLLVQVFLQAIQLCQANFLGQVMERIVQVEGIQPQLFGQEQQLLDRVVLRQLITRGPASSLCRASACSTPAQADEAARGTTGTIWLPTSDATSSW
jgi:hypothetical protein